MPVGYSPEHLFAKPNSTTRFWWQEGQKWRRLQENPSKYSFSTFDPCKAIMEDASVQETVNHLFHIGPEKAVPGGEPIVIGLLQRLKVILNTLIVLRLLWLSGPVDRGYAGQFPSPGKRLRANPTRNTVN